MTLEAYIDGGSRGNPGEAGCGVYVPGVVRIAEFLGKQTNNYAEYSALLAALRFAVDHRADSLKVYADSELVVKQINGDYKVRNENIKPLFEQAQRLIRQLRHFSISHIYREQNKEADKLANLAMNKKENVMLWEATG